MLARVIVWLGVEGVCVLKKEEKDRRKGHGHVFFLPAWGLRIGSVAAAAAAAAAVGGAVGGVVVGEWHRRRRRMASS